MKRAWLLPMRRQPFLPRRARHCVAFALSAWLFLPTGDSKRLQAHATLLTQPQRSAAGQPRLERRVRVQVRVRHSLPPRCGPCPEAAVMARLTNVRIA